MFETIILSSFVIIISNISELVECKNDFNDENFILIGVFVSIVGIFVIIAFLVDWFYCRPRRMRHADLNHDGIDQTIIFNDGDLPIYSILDPNKETTIQMEEIESPPPPSYTSLVFKF
jgi:hypothetical protein